MWTKPLAALLICINLSSFVNANLSEEEQVIQQILGISPGEVADLKAVSINF
jgi:hypothetical protein